MVGQLTNDNLPSGGKQLRLKADHRLSRNFYKGVNGDTINVLLAAAAYNFKRAYESSFVPYKKNQHRACTDKLYAEI